MSVGNLFSSNTNNLTYPGGRYEPSSPVTNAVTTAQCFLAPNGIRTQVLLTWCPSLSHLSHQLCLAKWKFVQSKMHNCPKKVFLKKMWRWEFFFFFWGILFPFASMIKPSWSDSVALSHRIKRLIRLNLSRTKTEFDSEKGFNGCLGLEQAPIYLSLNTFWDWTRALCRSKNFGLFHNFNLFYILDSYHWKYQTAIQLRCVCSKVRLG